MGDNIANQNNLSFGPYGTIQLSDGAGLFTGTDVINVNTLTGILYATQFVGDGGLLSNIQGGGGGSGNVGYGNPGEVAYYTGNYNVEGLSEITVDSGTGLINIHSNSHATNVTLKSVIFDVSANVDSNTNIDYYPTLQAVCDTGNTYTGALTANAFLGPVREVATGTLNCALGSVFHLSDPPSTLAVSLQNVGTSARTITLIVDSSGPFSLSGFTGRTEAPLTGQAPTTLFEFSAFSGRVLARAPKYFS